MRKTWFELDDFSCMFRHGKKNQRFEVAQNDTVISKNRPISYVIDCKIANKYTCFWFLLSFMSTRKNSCMTIRKHYKTLETFKKLDPSETF